MTWSGYRSIWIRQSALTVMLVLSQGQFSAPAQAQGWWPWATPEAPVARPPPIPREPVYRGPGQPGQQGIPGPIPQQPQAGFGQKAPICLQLEARLVQEGQRGSTTRDQLPRIEAEMRQVERANQAAQSQLERSDCYDYFLFAKSLKRTRACVDLANQADGAKRRLAEFEAQRQQIMQSGGRSLREDIVRELARINCGPAYQQEARNSSGPFSGLWQDEEGGGPGGGKFGNLPYSTFRTVCVRLCDGYYFPVSFSTLPNNFDHDSDVCQQRCAAPAELYYHQNPGGTVEQAIAHKTKQPYTTLRTAFRFRKEFVAGCSCKQTEYVPGPGQPPAERRAEAAPGAPVAASPGATPIAAPTPRR